MTDEEREKKQIEKNAKSFARNHFKQSFTKQNAAIETYLLIVRDGILY